jgi:hypothetical protein
VRSRAGSTWDGRLAWACAQAWRCTLQFELPLGRWFGSYKGWRPGAIGPEEMVQGEGWGRCYAVLGWFMRARTSLFCNDRLGLKSCSRSGTWP